MNILNRLKKTVIYNYLIIVSVLLIVEWYLYQFVYYHSSIWSKKTGIPENIFTMSGVFLICIVFCITSYVYYEKIRKITQEETRRQVKERNLMFANIAHDLKNPMSSVLGYARALEENMVSEGEKGKTYHLIAEKSNQMNDMILKMFQYAKMESEEYNLTSKETDLCSLLRSILSDRYMELEQREIDLEIQLPDEKILILLDENEFRRVIDNIITNVIKHNDIGIRMLVSVSRIQNGKVKIVIGDSGNTIPEVLRGSIFEPFTCSDVSRVKKDGSGLGLAISKRIIELHGGKIYVDDSVEGYTKAFVIEM